MTKKNINVYVIEDHPIFRSGLVQLINQQENMAVTGEAESKAEALELFNKEIPDLALVDISLKNSNGLDLIKHLTKLYPDTILIVLTMHDEVLFAERAIKAGVKGYIIKEEASTQVLKAITEVLNNKIYISDKIKKNVLERLEGRENSITELSIDKLSNREFEIFELIGKGLGTTEISQKVFLSIKTIETYKEHLKQKLNVNSASELRKLAIQWYQNKESLL
jgi:DNA-binding NarL/FixJ family response regulator